MKKILLFAFCFSFFGSFSFIDERINEYEVRYINYVKVLDPVYQTQLRINPAWQDFLKTNPNWFVYFNESNQKPHRAFGEPIQLTGSDLSEMSINFIENHLTMFNIPINELEVEYQSKDEKFQSISFLQKHKNLEVINSRLYLKITNDNKLICFGLDVFSSLDIDIQPGISVNQVIESAEKRLENFNNISFVEQDLKILAIPKQRKYDFRLVYVVNVETVTNIGPANYICYVDAHNGELLMRKNTYVYESSMQSLVHVEGDVYTTNPNNAATVVDFVDLKVRDLSTGTNHYTDTSGNIALSSPLGSSVNVSLEGRYAQIQTNSLTPNYTTTLTGTNNYVFDNSNSTVQERTAYYSVTNIHNFFKEQFPTYTGLDFPMEVNVDIGNQGGCNAFYGGSTINFYEEDGGCHATAKFPDVGYHEYGHAINAYRYNSGMWNGGLNEGTADVWALTLTGNPILGHGWQINDPQSNVRRYDMDPKVYPEDLVGEVHADGEIICGAIWDTYQNLGSMQQTLDLFTSIYNNGPDGPNGDEGLIYTDVLLEFLYADDNDGNIFNGTPNDDAIVDAFAKHGITLLSNAVVTHTPVDSSFANNAIDIDVSITMTYPWALNSAYCYYKLNNFTQWDSIPMNPQGGNLYQGQISSQPSGTIIPYYVALVDNYNKKSGVSPVAAHLDQHANIPYFILNGFEMQVDQKNDFDNYLTGFWDDSHPSDNATTGEWEIGVPEGTYYDNTVPVQTSQQHTPGGVYCAFTGNDNTGGSIGANDVDDGHTTLTSPAFDLTGYTNPTFTYYRWYTNSPPTGANPGADWWQVLVTDDGVNWHYVENNMSSDNSWRKFAFRVKDYVNITNNFKIKFIASDSTRLGQYLDGGSLVEAAIDDLFLYEQSAAVSVDNLENTQFNIFPNPTNGKFEMSWNFSDHNLVIKIFNNLGEVILSKDFNGLERSMQFDLSNFSKGVYYVEMHSDRFISTKKLILE